MKVISFESNVWQEVGSLLSRCGPPVGYQPPHRIQNISNFRRVRFFGRPRCTYFSTSTHSMCVYVGVGFLGVLWCWGAGCVSMCTVRAPSTCSFPIFKNEKKNENIFITYFSCHLDLTRYFN